MRVITALAAPTALPCQRINPLSGGPCGMGPNSPAHGPDGTHGYTARDRRNRDRRAEDDRNPARHPNRAQPPEPLHASLSRAYREGRRAVWNELIEHAETGIQASREPLLATIESSDIASALANTEPVSPDEPDPNRLGMPKCPRCGDIAYRPDAIGSRLQAWRCGGCHFTLSRCKCAIGGAS